MTPRPWSKYFGVGPAWIVRTGRSWGAQPPSRHRSVARLADRHTASSAYEDIATLDGHSQFIECAESEGTLITPSIVSQNVALPRLVNDDSRRIAIGQLVQLLQRFQEMQRFQEKALRGTDFNRVGETRQSRDSTGWHRRCWEPDPQSAQRLDAQQSLHQRWAAGSNLAQSEKALLRVRMMA